MFHHLNNAMNITNVSKGIMFKEHDVREFCQARHRRARPTKHRATRSRPRRSKEPLNSRIIGWAYSSKRLFHVVGLLRFRRVMTAYPDLVVKFDRLEPKGDRVLYHWTFTGTNAGRGGAGNQVRISGYENGRIGRLGRID